MKSQIEILLLIYEKLNLGLNFMILNLYELKMKV